MSEFKNIMDQKRTAQVHVVQGSCTPITKERIIGRVTAAFNLGKKVEVDMELYGVGVNQNGKPTGGVFRFENIDDVYYVVKQDE